jgi:FkbM family methyltransferase
MPPDPTFTKHPSSATEPENKPATAADIARLDAGLEAVNAKLGQMIRLLDEQVALQRASFLEDGHILRFFAPGGTRVALSLPDARHDYVQRTILRSGTFFEAPLLARVAALNLIGNSSTVLDVGANIGNHSVFFGAVLGARRLIAFEPQAHCAQTLATNLALNGLEGRATIHRSLVGAAPGQGRMIGFQPRNLGGTSFASDAQGGLPLTSLDAAIAADDRGNVDFIKIDVEGMQMEVLRGATDLLSEQAPALWIELRDADEARAEAERFLARFGYGARQISPTDFLFTARR